jgi:uncharacterized protein with PIN domain
VTERNHTQGCATSQAPGAGAGPLLFVDAMLGRLARWLRLLGYDTLYASKLSDHQIAARARAEGRVVLTRDRELAQRRGIRTLYVRSQDWQEQIEEVVDALGLPAPGAEARCPQCNAVLVEVSPAQVRPRVPAHVFQTQHEFHYCPRCGQYYWPGSHWENIQSAIAQVLAKESEDSAERSDG